MSKLDELLEALLEEIVDDFNEKHKTKKEDFKPHIESCVGGHLGVIGEKTNFKDINGKELYTGDIVSVMRNNKHIGLTFIVKHKIEGFNVAGAFGGDFTNGFDKKENLSIVKMKSYKELTHNEGIKDPELVAKLKFED